MGADTKTAFPKLTTIGGDLYASGADTKTAFPKLTTIGGALDARGADTKTAFSKLTTIGGYLYAMGADTKTAFPKLTTIGGYLYARGADTKTAFPKLTTIGGALYASGADTKTAFPKLTKQTDPDARAKCVDALFRANLKLGYFYVDGILSSLVNRKGHVARVIVCGKTAMSYVVDDGRSNYSHGETLREARSGLLYKLTSHDTAQFKVWKLDAVVSLGEVIQAYRAITGACEAGTRHFCEQQGKLPEKIKIADAIKMTRGQYGHDAFAKFFK
jgi:hypothetical protein